MSKRIHFSFDVMYLIKLPDEKLSGALIADGIPLGPDDARRMLARLIADGYEVVPVCPNHDEKGYCPGHVIEEGGAS